jgi:hypothetical protein
MATPNRPARLNRALLTLAGVLLLLGGAYVLLRGTGVLASLSAGQAAADGLVAGGPSAPWWLAYVVIVVAALVGVLCLLWLAAQIGRRLPGSEPWHLPTEGAGGSTVLDADAAATAVADEIEAYPGVRRTRAALTGSRLRPRLHLTVTTEEDAPLTELRQRIATEALPRLRGALEIEELPTEILVRLGETTGRRTA